LGNFTEARGGFKSFLRKKGEIKKTKRWKRGEGVKTFTPPKNQKKKMGNFPPGGRGEPEKIGPSVVEAPST